VVEQSYPSRRLWSTCRATLASAGISIVAPQSIGLAINSQIERSNCLVRHNEWKKALWRSLVKSWRANMSQNAPRNPRRMLRWVDPGHFILMSVSASLLAGAGCGPNNTSISGEARRRTVAQAVEQTSVSCRQCHAEAFSTWQPSDHAQANRLVDPHRDASAFSANPRVEDGGSRFALAWRDGRAVRTERRREHHPAQTRTYSRFKAAVAAARPCSGRVLAASRCGVRSAAQGPVQSLRAGRPQTRRVARRQRAARLSDAPSPQRCQSRDQKLPRQCPPTR